MIRLMMFLLGYLFGVRRQSRDGVGVSGADSYNEANHKAVERLDRWNDPR